MGREAAEEMVVNYKVCSTAWNPRIETRPDACPIARTLLWTAARIAR